MTNAAKRHNCRVQTRKHIETDGEMAKHRRGSMQLWGSRGWQIICALSPLPTFYLPLPLCPMSLISNFGLSPLSLPTQPIIRLITISLPLVCKPSAMTLPDTNKEQKLSTTFSLYFCCVLGAKPNRWHWIINEWPSGAGPESIWPERRDKHGRLIGLSSICDRSGQNRALRGFATGPLVTDQSGPRSPSIPRARINALVVSLTAIDRNNATIRL